MNASSTRAMGIIIAAHAAGVSDDDLVTRLQDFLDVDETTDDLGLTIRASFTGDDDYDDMIHEVDHALARCSDDDDDCPWNDDEMDEDTEADYIADMRESGEVDLTDDDNYIVFLVDDES